MSEQRETQTLEYSNKARTVGSLAGQHKVGDVLCDAVAVCLPVHQCHTKACKTYASTNKPGCLRPEHWIRRPQRQLERRHPRTCLQPQAVTRRRAGQPQTPRAALRHSAWRHHVQPPPGDRRSVSYSHGRRGQGTVPR